VYDAANFARGESDPLFKRGSYYCVQKEGTEVLSLNTEVLRLLDEQNMAVRKIFIAMTDAAS
jgi:hypothetical protein